MIRHCLLAGLALAAAPAVAGEYTTYRLLDIVQATAGPDPGCRATALLNLPTGWHSGDAAVVLLTAAPMVDATRDRLVAALLEEQAAVLEVVTAPCPENGASDAAGDALGALRALHVTEGAGLVVAIGYGPGGRAASAAAEEAERRLGPGGPR
ncbi:hypothetical protein, partial [Neoroseomonas rubea]|uniref:hypothetical protein n=1 Tax=Neoroseomonas rubea TaxID=2748666 RepID=UPI0018DF6B06